MMGAYVMSSMWAQGGVHSTNKHLRDHPSMGGVGGGPGFPSLSGPGPWIHAPAPNSASVAGKLNSGTSRRNDVLKHDVVSGVASSLRAVESLDFAAASSAFTESNNESHRSGE